MDFHLIPFNVNASYLFPLHVTESCQKSGYHGHWSGCHSYIAIVLVNYRYHDFHLAGSPVFIRTVCIVIHLGANHRFQVDIHCAA